MTLPGQAEPAGRPTLRILAVDDEPVIRRMISSLLGLEGHQVVTAGSGEEALQILAAEPFDIVLSDVAMGEGMTGWDLLEEVRLRWPGLRFALATGWGASIDANEARARGVEAVITKPYRLGDLTHLLQPPRSEP
ncbi:MAG TPA: response regulator [Dehalococcoidia bacterium]|nr:response regulator [Dehalococcoidia bacterium]